MELDWIFWGLVIFLFGELWGRAWADSRREVCECCPEGRSAKEP